MDTDNKILYSINAVFTKPDDIINAADKVAAAGYKKYDVNTPYPVHGMDSAMKLKPSKMGYIALVLGLTGTTLALLGMYLAMVVDYPIIIGGKPFFALPAFIPITFELTVLLAAVGTALSMLFVFFKLPNNTHPVHDTRYMQLVSSDHYGIYIKADDPKFNEKEIHELFKELGAAEIIEVFLDEDEVFHRHRLFTPKFISFLAGVAILISMVAYLTLNKALYKPPFNFMMEQDRVNAQMVSKFFPDGYGMREPVSGTVAQGHFPYLYKDNPDEAGQMLVNPLTPTEDVLKLGQKKFNTYCSPCHDNLATGNNRLRGQFPNPPSLHSEKVRNWSDGRIFHVIEEGQGVMPSYAKQVTNREKWSIILYIRALQRAMNAKEEDMQ